MDTKNFAIGVLTITATVLLVGLVVISVLPQPTYASGIGVSAGEYTISVGRQSRDTELLYVIHNPTQRLLVYGVDTRGNQVAIIDARNLGG